MLDTTYQAGSDNFDVCYRNFLGVLQDEHMTYEDEHQAQQSPKAPSGWQGL